jgi:hypothetical protein
MALRRGGFGSRARAVQLAAALAGALVAAGCGGGGATGSATTSAATGWANSLCQATATWRNAITSAGQSLQNNPTEEGLKAAGQDVQGATRTFSQELGNLGKPETESGQQAQALVDQLAEDMSTGLDKIQTAIKGATDASSALSAVSTVSSTLLTAGDQVTTTIQKLQQLDAQGELGDAFRDADACSGVISTQ